MTEIIKEPANTNNKAKAQEGKWSFLMWLHDGLRVRLMTKKYDFQLKVVTKPAKP